MCQERKTNDDNSAAHGFTVIVTMQRTRSRFFSGSTSRRQENNARVHRQAVERDAEVASTIT
jgi:hypothetical protein